MKLNAFICCLVVICCPSYSYGGNENECEWAVQKVMEEIWKGELTSASVDNALITCEKFANEGDVEAQDNMGFLLMAKNDNKENQESYEWFLKAANNGHAYSQFHIGKMYEEGIVVNQDVEKADYWYQKSANSGLNLAQRKLGENYTSGIPEGADFSKGIYWYDKAAEQGDRKSIYFLIDFYSNGTEVYPANPEKAKYWTEKSEQ